MKIFGIGWAKTGTTTLRDCFRILGYTHHGHHLELVGDLDRVLRVAQNFETFQDWPWPLYYKELDQHFSGSKFVLTTRDSASWLRSYRNATDRQNPSKETLDARLRIYGVPYPMITDAQLIERYERHNREVQQYFSSRPRDLLVVDWANGDGWEELCGFLARPIPKRRFPHANRGIYS
jgi:hypothetical protein